MDTVTLVYELAASVDWREILREYCEENGSNLEEDDFSEIFMSSLGGALLDEFEERSRNVPYLFKEAMEQGLELIIQRFEQEIAEEGETSPAVELIRRLFEMNVRELVVRCGEDEGAVDDPDVAELLADLRMMNSVAPQSEPLVELPAAWLNRLQEEE